MEKTKEILEYLNINGALSSDCLAKLPPKVLRCYYKEVRKNKKRLDKIIGKPE